MSVGDDKQINDFVERYLGGADRDQLDPILDACVAVYRAELDEDGQVDFKGKAKTFTRTCGFLSSVLPYTNAGWEKRSIFLNFLVSKQSAHKILRPAAAVTRPTRSWTDYRRSSGRSTICSATSPGGTPAGCTGTSPRISRPGWRPTATPSSPLAGRMVASSTTRPRCA